MKQSSYEMMVRAYSPDLLRFAYWMCRNRWQAQDLASAASTRVQISTSSGDVALH